MCSLNPNCYNNDAPRSRNNRKSFRRGCYKCIARDQRERYMLQHTYWHLKSNAKRRGIIFELTIPQWKIFCNRTGYLKLRGQSANSMTVDRKDPNKGYTIKNIRPLTLSQNVKKKKAELLKKFVAKIDPDVPF